MTTARLWTILAALGSVLTANALARADLVNAQTPWRAWLVQGANMVWDKRALKLLRGHGRGDFYPAAVDTEKSGFSRRPHASATNKGK